MGWKLNKKNITHALVSPGTALPHALHRTAGKKVRDKLRLNRKRFFPSVSSAGSYAYARGEYYGPTGSIVGRY